MSLVFPAVLFIVLSVIGVLALIHFARLYRSVRGQSLPFERVIDPAPPDPVVAGGDVRTAAGLAIAWAALHVAVVAVWLAGRFFIPLTMLSALWATYAIGLAVATGVGAAMMMQRRPFGRRLVGISQMLLALAAMLVLAVVVLSGVREGAIHVAAAALLAGHLAIDVALGTWAQRVGLPAGTHAAPFAVR